MNDDKNLLGRLIALALIVGVAYGVNGIARGRFLCPTGTGSCCAMSAHGADEHAEPGHHHDHEAVEERSGADHVDSDGDEDAIKAKAPVVPAKAESPAR